MGYMRHHALVITSWHEDLPKIHARAVELCAHLVSPIVRGSCNGYASFFIAPDGSKEGWDISDDGDDNRSTLISELEAMRYEDGSSPIDWVEVQFGDDERITKVTKHSDEAC